MGKNVKNRKCVKIYIDGEGNEKGKKYKNLRMQSYTTNEINKGL